MEKNVQEEKNLTQNELGTVAGGRLLGSEYDYCYETCPKCGAVFKAKHQGEARQELNAHMASCTGGGASGGW